MSQQYADGLKERWSHARPLAPMMLAMAVGNEPHLTPEIVQEINRQKEIDRLRGLLADKEAENIQLRTQVMESLELLQRQFDRIERLLSRREVQDG
jgi:hypothetical protein